MKEKDFLEKIYKKHVKQLKNLLVSHKKLMICFSGIPGSGKTHVAKILEKRYKGVKVRSDDIRKIVIGLDWEGDINEITHKYLDWFFDKYSFKNKLVILDRGIDRRYSLVFPLFRKKGYQIFVIRLKTSREVLERRIFEKNNCRDPHFDSEIERWTKEWKNFGKNVKSNILIENEDKLNLGPLFLELDKIVR